MNRDDIEIKSAITQHHIHNPNYRSVTLDVFATDHLDNEFNIEIQRDDENAHPKRARFHASMMDAHTVEKGTPFKKIPENYVIFMTEHNVLKQEQSVCHIDRVIMEKHETFKDEQHIIYVSAAVNDHSPTSELMHDFMTADYHKIHNPKLAELVKFYKENKEERKNMCESIRQYGLSQRDEGRMEGLNEGRIQGKTEGKIEEQTSIILKMSLKGLSVDYISSLIEIPKEKVEALINNA